MTREELDMLNAIESEQPPTEPRWEDQQQDPQAKIADAYHWTAWAKAVIAKHGEQMTKRMQELNAALTEADRWKTIAAGLRAELEERKGKTVEVLGVGTAVKLTMRPGDGGERFQATVQEVQINSGGPRYLLYWWWEGERRSAWVGPAEVERAGDDLPLPRMFPAGIDLGRRGG